MKKIICVCLLLSMLVSSVICVQAAGSAVKFTGSSQFVVGGTSAVDLKATAQSVMDDGSVTSDMYNAALEQNMSVIWKCSNGPDKTGNSVTWTAEDAGREYVCRVGFYSDKACTEFVDYIDSDTFVIAEQAPQEPPTITTKTLPKATVGESYSVKLKCTDPKASFGEHYNPGKANDLAKTGLTLTAKGELKGTPTKAGKYTFTVCAAGEGGEGYMTYTLVVEEAPKETEPATQPTEATTQPETEPTQAQTEPMVISPAPTQTTAPQEPEPEPVDKPTGNIWIYIGIGVGALSVGVVAGILIRGKSKKS